MTICSIYRITNINSGKVYIGFTSQKPKERWYSHISASRKPHVTRKSYISRAIRKHGPEQFDFEVIYQSLDRDHTLAVMEPYFIREYGSIKSGYNLTTGGEGPSHTPESRAKISAANRGRTMTDFMRKRLRETNVGRPMSEEQKEKLRIARTGKPLSAEHREKLSIVGKGRVFTEEHKKNLSAAGTGRKLTEEEKEKIRVARTGKPLSAEHRAKVAEAGIGRKATEETRERLRASFTDERKDNLRGKLCKTYEVTCPDGSMIVVTRMPEFCREHNLTRSLMYQVANGKATHHKGYRCETVQ